MSATLLNLSYVLVIALEIYLTNAQSPPQLNIQNAKDQIIVRPGEVATIECPVRNNRELMYDWYKDNESIMTYGIQRIRILSSGVLRIKDSVFDDTGVYKCRAINGYGSVEHNTTLLVLGNDEDYENYGELFSDDFDPDESKLSLTAKPSLLFITQEESPLFRQLGTTFRLLCIATGHPKPEIMWYKDGVPIAKMKRIGRWSLKFTNAMFTDSGNYTCVAGNIVGTASHSWSLVVDDRNHPATRGRPLLTGTNTTVYEGDRAVLECTVKSESFPHIEWLKQIDPADKDSITSGTPIPMEGDYYNVLTTPYAVDYMVRDGIYFHKLIIENAQTEDSGKYVCLGANSFGYEYRFSYLEVIPKSSGYSSVPFPIIVTATVAGIAVLGCLLAIFVYCCPRKRTVSRDSSTAVPMVNKKEFAQLQPRRPSKPRCTNKNCRGKPDHKVTYFAGHTNGIAGHTNGMV